MSCLQLAGVSECQRQNKWPSARDSQTQRQRRSSSRTIGTPRFKQITRTKTPAPPHSQSAESNSNAGGSRNRRGGTVVATRAMRSMRTSTAARRVGDTESAHGKQTSRQRDCSQASHAAMLSTSRLPIETPTHGKHRFRFCQVIPSLSWSNCTTSDFNCCIGNGRRRRCCSSFRGSSAFRFRGTHYDSFVIA
jgi:hypothetical protein